MVKHLAVALLLVAALLLGAYCDGRELKGSNRATTRRAGSGTSDGGLKAPVLPLLPPLPNVPLPPVAPVIPLPPVVPGPPPAQDATSKSP